MARKTKRNAGDTAKAAAGRERLEDSAIRSLSRDEIKRLAIDAWEPSLLRHMLEAQKKLERR